MSNKLKRIQNLYTFRKPLGNSQEIKQGDFLQLKDGFLYKADGSMNIEGISQDSISSPLDNETTMNDGCTYIPVKRRDVFDLDVVGGTLTQLDVGSTFLINSNQEIDYTSKAPIGGHFRLEEIASQDGTTGNRGALGISGRFTYNFETALSPAGPKGDDAVAPTITIGSVGTGPANVWFDSASTPTNYILNFTVPQGVAGGNGSDGTDGGTGPAGPTIDLNSIAITMLPYGTAPTASITGTGLTRQIILGIPYAKDGDNGLTWTPRGDYNSGTTYNYLDCVRRVAPDGVGALYGWTLTTPTINVDPSNPNWMMLVRDGNNGARGDDGGTIVVPVEGKPGKDGNVGAPGKDGTDGKSPASYGDWDSGSYYPELAIVRADTGEVDDWGLPIFGSYIARSGASAGEEPKDGTPWDLLNLDGVAPDVFRNNSCTLYNVGGSDISIPIDAGGNTNLFPITFDFYSGTKTMATSGGINILRSGYYKISFNGMLNLNGAGTTGVQRIANVARISIYADIPGLSANFILASTKLGGPFSYTQGPRISGGRDFNIWLPVGTRLRLMGSVHSDYTPTGSSVQVGICGPVQDGGSGGSSPYAGGTNISALFYSPHEAEGGVILGGI